MPKTARQLDREIAAALGSPSQNTSATPRFTIHGVKQGIIKVEYAKTAVAANLIARRMAGKGFMITVLDQDPRTQEYRAVLVSKRVNGKMKVMTPDDGFQRAAGRGR